MDWTGYYLASMVSALLHGSLLDIVGQENIYSLAIGTGIVAFIPLAIWIWVVRYLEQRSPELRPATGD